MDRCYFKTRHRCAYVTKRVRGEGRLKGQVKGLSAGQRFYRPLDTRRETGPLQSRPVGALRATGIRVAYGRRHGGR